MKYFLFFFLIGTCFPMIAQTPITHGEWFWDTDPGYGNGNIFQPGAPDTVISVNLAVGTTPPGPGPHRWHVRVRDSARRWSHTYMRHVYILPFPDSLGLQAAEWFWDSDPGYGNGNPLGLSSFQDSASWMLDLSSLSPGFHTLYVRARHGLGQWSHTYDRGVYVRAHPDSNIDRFTYVFKTDTSISASFTYTLTQPAHIVSVSFQPDTSSLVPGTTYEFCIQAVRTDSAVSCEQCEQFFWDQSVGIDAWLPSANIKLYPNPTSGHFYLQWEQAPQQRLHMSIIDVRGRRSIYKEKIDTIMNASRYLTGFLPPAAGMYFVVLESNGRVQVKQLMVK